MTQKDKVSGCTLLTKVLPQWPRLSSTDPTELTDLLEIASLVSDESLALRLLNILDLGVLRRKNTKATVDLIGEYGESWALDLLKSWSGNKSYGPERILDLPFIIGKLISYKRVVRWLLGFQFKSLVASDKSLEKSANRVELDRRRNETAKVMCEVLRAANGAEDTETGSKAVAHILKHKRTYSVLGLADLVKCLFRGSHRNPDWKQLLTECTNRLNVEVAKKRDRNDFTILDTVLCNCQDCRVLSHFLESRDKKQLVWPLAKDRRQHIHGVIDGMGVCVSHTTQRTGSPHKLTLVKLDEHFNKELHYRSTVAEYLAWIKKIDC